METLVTIDEKLLERARHLTGLTDRDDILDEALRALVEREAARKLSELGGTVPDIKAPPRRRDDLE